MKTKLFLIVKDGFAFLWKRKRYAICIMLFSAFFGTLINLYVSEMEKWREEENEDYFAYYRVIDNLVGEYEKEFLKKDDAIRTLIQLCNLMHKTENGKYIELYDNPIYIESGNVSNTANMWEDTKTGIELPNRGESLFDKVNCLWCGKNVFDEFKLEVSTGDRFSEKNFEYNLPTTSVILGASFSNTLTVGDEILLENYFGNSKGKVVGILKKDQFVICGDNVINLNNYILIPLYDVQEKEALFYDSFRIKDLYLMKINGEYTNVKSINMLQQELNNVYKMLDVYPPAQVGMSPYAISLTIKTSIYSLVVSLGVLGIVVSVFSVLLTIVFVLEVHKKNMNVYSAYITCGYTSKMLKVIDYMLFFIPTSLGIAPVIIGSTCVNGRYTLYAVFLLETVIVFISIAIMWRKDPIVNYLQETYNVRI